LSYYTAATGPDPETDVGAIVVTPGATLAEMRTVDAGVAQLDSDIRRSTTLPATWVNAWGRFAAEWREFFDEHQWWTDRLWAGAYERTVNYRRRLADWRADFVRQGGKPSGPGVDASESSPVRGLLWVAGLGAAAFAGYRLVKWLRTKKTAEA
jgi:hypothetical protein